MALFPDRPTHGEPVDAWRRLAGFVSMCVCVCVCGCCVRRASMCVCVRVSVNCVSNERFYVSSTVTVRTSAIHVSPSMSTREAPSTNQRDSP